MKINHFFGALAFGALVLASGFAKAEFADVSADFSITNGNPNGSWSYGYRNALADPTNLYTTTIADAGGFLVWHTPGLSGDGTPSVFKNTGSSSTNNIAPGSFGMHSGPGGQYSVAQYAVQNGGTLRISGEWGVGDIGLTDIFIQLNGVTLWSRLSSPVAEAFDFNIATNSGDLVQFVLGPAGAYQFDSTPLTATIETVPEPATMSLVGIGLVTAGLRRRRKAS
ncbi:MAG: PEP-CTERM sorting domain-containing protein [Fimbriimonadaceae bacterium]|nr:MAG: PEP-CTERM sorting domain-containing protein [Fimbriimonadaceae bacterium]